MVNPWFSQSKRKKTATDYVVVSLVEKQNAAVAVAELCLDIIIGGGYLVFTKAFK